jgi:hypothetical protein
MEGFERVHVPDATRHAALRCLLRVTADDIRQRYAAPVSGILAPQPVGNLRRHKTVARLPTVAAVASE